jgi:NAD(P)-dependent dehydrogenase (short-subunit alcohol dehydrogenase family)
MFWLGGSLAIATEFARLGASIVIASRKAEHLAQGEAVLRAIPGPASA